MTVQEQTNDIAALIEQVKQEDNRYRTESRAIEREPIMIPVALSCNDGEVVHSFSRNLSTEGICLVTTEPMKEGTVANMLLSRSDGNISEITASCKWTKAFGAAHCISGWKFKDLVDNDWS